MLVVGLITAGKASAQTRIGLDVGYGTQFLWRGQTFIRGPVVQSTAFASFRRHSYIGTVGGRTTVDLARRRHSGFGKRWFGESNLWLDFTSRFSGADVSVGWIGYLLALENARGLFASRANTQELYVGVQIPLRRFMYGFTVWYDIDQLPGAYAEGQFAIRVPLWNRVALPVGSLWLRGKIGVNTSEAMRVVSDSDTGYFDARGVTHFTLAFSTTFGVVPLGIAEGAAHIELGFVRKIDSRVRLGTLGQTKDDRGIYFRMVMTLAGPRCIPNREICSD